MRKWSKMEVVQTIYPCDENYYVVGVYDNYGCENQFTFFKSKNRKHARLVLGILKALGVGQP